MVTEKKPLTLNDILDNPIEELYIDGFGTLKIRCPTTRDKIEAKADSLKTPGFDSLSSLEQATEVSRRTAVKMIVDPKFSEEDYLNSNDVKMSILLDTVSMWYATKIKQLNDKRSKLMEDFLEQMKASSP